MNAQRVISILGEVPDILNITNDLEIHNFVSHKVSFLFIYFFILRQIFAVLFSVKTKNRFYLMIAIIDKMI